MKRRARVLLLALALIAAAIGAIVLGLNPGDDDTSATAETPSTLDRLARGAYLARAGNCAGCHTARGAAPYAGGREIATPFGSVSTSNLTPDTATGIGSWTATDFWRALHHGRSRDGRLLYPAFPYPNYSLVTRDDADALFAYLQSLAPVAQANRPHALSFPYNTQAALAVWRTLYFRPASFAPDPQQSAEWNRGAYLVQGLGHCNACHARRNPLGATADAFDLGGGLMPMQHWYAPSLTSPHEAGMAGWDTAQAVALLRTGVAGQAVASGPMAEVVRGSLQHLSEADLRAMVTYLQALPPTAESRPADAAPAVETPRGAQLYETHCASCHGEHGEGVPGAYPALAGNRALLIDPPANLVLAVLGGGFAPATAGNPRPFGMPPFATVLNDAEIAELLTTLRSRWGHHGSAVSTLDVSRLRGSASR